MIGSAYADSALNQEVIEIQNALQAEFSPILTSAHPENSMVVIVGDQISGVEIAALEIIKSQVKRPELVPLIVKKESKEILDEALQTSKTVFLVGGPSQNLVTRRFVDDGLVKIPGPGNAKVLVISRGNNKVNSKVIVLSDLRGINNVARDSARLSPLAKFIPVKYVPVAASGIGVLLAYLLKFAKVYGGKKVSSIGKKKAEVKEKYLGFKVKHFHVKAREYISILIGAAAYGLAIALSYTGIQSALLKTLQVSLLACLIVFGIKELIRLFMSFKAKIHAEFVFWIPGAIIALISGWLGNTMNSVAFLLEIKDSNFSSDKLAKIKYTVIVLAFVAGIIFFVLNLLHATKLYQMIMASATTSSMAEIFAIKPLAGKDIKAWKPRLWIFTLIIMAILYVLINFVI